MARSVRAQLAVAEVASHESPRLHGQSNRHPIGDGLRVLRTLFDVRFSLMNVHAFAVPTRSVMSDLVPVAEA